MVINNTDFPTNSAYTGLDEDFSRRLMDLNRKLRILYRDERPYILRAKTRQIVTITKWKTGMIDKLAIIPAKLFPTTLL
jgi:hypothetical protein